MEKKKVNVKKLKDDRFGISAEFKERAIKLLPLARDFINNKDPGDVLEYVKSMDPKDSYILGMLIGRMIERK